MLMHRPQTPQPGFGSTTLLQKFTPHFKILDPRLTLKSALKFYQERTMSKTKENKQFIVPVHNLKKIINHVFKELNYLNMHQTVLNSNNILKTVIIIILYLYNILTQQMFHLFLAKPFVMVLSSELQWTRKLYKVYCT